ncbi:concanavalin A-like lectin/glucanase domain-containing protein [Dactylonectria estremocensis]|uniref:Concanavalin A-like lectin/glucanase domain-containing protein n=1 Tax=Dactylonectria estremocensis TaxID=1079267 RepID=A0A9P9EVC9_9HYPO|nr:concanavalin A-like lectin/glucanase domain-containing protein [Dactylonectria estremocensis]
MRLDFTLTALLAASLSQAQYLISELSFGHAGRISPAESRGQIPNFVLQGAPQMPEVLSNRIILTPLAPGNQRGAVWSQQSLQRSQWIADVDFRANGPDRGGGNLNVWLVRGGPGTVGSSSIYTVGKFDGFALVLDKQGSQGGIIRGYLNDGTTDYSSKQRVEELAFGHCPYAYRNLGRPSQIKLRQTSSSFRVEIDGQLCFETTKFSIPTGYQFGVTAATPDTPDSFEVFKLVVMSDSTDTSSEDARKQQTPNKNPPSNGNSNNNNYNNNNNNNNYNNNAKKDKYDDGDLADEDPDIFQTSKTQFMDLHNRLQSTNHQLSALHRVASRHQQQDEKRQEEIMQVLGQLRSGLAKVDEIHELQGRITDLDKEIQSLRRELTRKFQANERSVKAVLSDHHSSLSEAVLESTPGHKFLIFVFFGTQGLLITAYLIYKRRRNSMPKKYL